MKSLSLEAEKGPDSREALLRPYILEKSVLDLGVGDIRDRFLHKFIAGNAREAVGLESDAVRVARLRAQGYDICEGDAQNFDLARTFDVVVAGDLIEHLTNFDGFFSSAGRHLTKSGVFIINTPNLYSINCTIRGLLGIIRDFEEHSCGFDEVLLRQLVARYPQFRIRDFIYFSHRTMALRSMFIRTMAKLNKKYNEHMMIVLEKT